jgi:hypothetical protein
MVVAVMVAVNDGLMLEKTMLALANEGSIAVIGD